MSCRPVCQWANALDGIRGRGAVHASSSIGGYRFSEYLRIGVPMNLLMWAVTVLIAPLAWPFAQ